MRATPVSFTLRDEQVPDSICLTCAEQCRLEDLERIVDDGLEKFLATGQALSEIRNKRLFRCTHPTFEAYCRSRFSLARSSADQLLRSSMVAEHLLNNGCELPSNTTEATIRPLTTLPTEELQSVTWELVRSLAPERATQPLVSKLCRMVRNLVDGEGDSALKAPGRHHRSTARLERETPFVRPVLRLAAWSGFNPEVVTSHIAESANARTLFSACTEMITRCRQVQQRLRTRFPDMEDSLVQHNQR
jgi:hypothetical protein